QAEDGIRGFHVTGVQTCALPIWISDFQRSTFGTPPAPDTAVRWHLVPISPTLNDNVFIDTAYLENPFAIGQELTSLKVKVRNDRSEERRVGKEARRRWTLRLSLR